MTNNFRNGINKLYKEHSAHVILNYKRRNKEPALWDSSLPFPETPMWVCILLVGVLAAMCYFPSLEGDFVFDDSEAVINNVDVRPTSPLWNIFLNDYWGTRLHNPTSHKSYRPLTVLSFRLNYWLSGGLKPKGFHLTNIILHIIISILSLKVFDRIFGGKYRKASFLSALLFAVHPIHCEAVSGVVGRADLLCALLFFIAFLAYTAALDFEDSLTHCLPLAFVTISLIFTLISMLCKEQGITVLGLCCIYDIIHCWKRNWRGFFSLHGFIMRHIIMILWGIGLLAIRWIIMGGTVPKFQQVDNPASFAPDIFTRIMSYNYIYSINAWLLICPEWLCFDWAMGCVPLLNTVFDLRNLSSLTFWIIMFLLLKNSLLYMSTNTSRALFISLATIVITFLPATNLLFRVGFVLAERVLYLPSVGYCAIITLGFRQLSVTYPNHKNIIRCILLLLLLIMTLRAGQRSFEWRSERTLFRSALNVCPLNAKVHYNIAKNAADFGERKLALKEYSEALRLYPDYEQALNNLGNLMRDEGFMVEAEKLLTRAVNLRPDFAAAWMNLGIVQAGLKRRIDAERSYKTALIYRGRYPDCYYNLGNLYLEQERYDEAHYAWKNATSLKPTHSVAWSNMVIMLDSIGKFELAEKTAEQALFYLPQEPGLHFNLANTLGKVKKFERAEYHFKKAITLDSKNPKYHANLGVLYHRWKKYALAETYYLNALQLEPHLFSAKENLEMLYRTMARSHRNI